MSQKPDKGSMAPLFFRNAPLFDILNMKQTIPCICALWEGSPMKSVTKIKLSNAQIEQLVKANFGNECEIGLISELKGGFFNTAYAIERKTEQDTIVLKVSVAKDTPILSYEKNTMGTEVEVFKLLSEQTTIPIPRLLASDFSLKLIPRPYFFMTMLKGVSLMKVKLSKENRDAINRELAEYFAQIHQIKGKYFGYFSSDPKEKFDTWGTAFYQMFEAILNDGLQRNIQLPYDLYKKVFRAHARVFDSVQVPLLVDYDLHPGNIFVIKKKEKYVIEGILDFERAFWGDPYAEFPAAFLLIDDVRKNPVFWTAYRNRLNIDHDLSRKEEIRVLFYRMYLFTIMCVEIYRYGFFYGKLQYLICKGVVKKCLRKLESMIPDQK